MAFLKISRRGQPTESAAGANQVPQPVTPVEVQSKHLDDALNRGTDYWVFLSLTLCFWSDKRQNVSQLAPA